MTAEAWRRLAVTLGPAGLDRDAVAVAARFAAHAHDGQLRLSGEPYVTHPLEVAALVVDAGGSFEMCVAALLHDVVEDTAVTLDEVRDRFGDDVAQLVDGCTKVSAVHPGAGEASLEAARLRKLFVALARDPRVVVVKVCDRLHNLRTVGSLPADKARRVGAETLAVHAPLAHRLGLGALKAELEDRAFAVAYPEDCVAVEAELAALGDLHGRLAGLRVELEALLDDVAPSVAISGRVKHRWSVHQKCRRLGVEPGDLGDLLGLRVVVGTPDECYAALAKLHSCWTPVPGRFKDYIQRPKLSGYRSLHTTVLAPDGRRVEVQIRTGDMHEQAERGLSAHHRYKTPGSEPRWLARLLEWDGATGEDDDEYVAAVRSELAVRSEVAVLTPGGDVLALPDGACCVDAAYAVHTDVGHGCVGAKVNGRLVPLTTRLADGDVVEILTGSRAGPSLQWLGFVATAKAKGRIRQFHAKKLRDDTRLAGRERLLRAARELRLAVRDEDAVFEQARGAAGVDSFDELFEKVGSGRLDPQRLLRPRVAAERVPSAPAPGSGAGLPSGSVAAALGLGEVAVRLAGCCRPAAGRPVVGIVGRQMIVVHDASCGASGEVIGTQPGRQVPMFWVRDGQIVDSFEVSAVRRGGLLLDVAAQVSSAGGELLETLELDPGRLEVRVAFVPRRRQALRDALSLLGDVRRTS